MFEEQQQGTVDLTFRNLDSEEARKLTQSADAYYALDEIKQMLRIQWKYVEFETEEARNLIENLYDQFHEICSELDIN